MATGYEVVPAASKYEVEPASPVERLASHPLTRFAVGAAAPIFGLHQLTQKILPTRAGQATQEDYRKFQEIAKRGYQGADIAGTLGQVFSPINVAAAKALPVAGSLAQRLRQGAGLGGFAAAGTPVEGQDFWKQKAAQVGTGMATGGAVPLGLAGVERTGRAVRDISAPILDLFRKSGPVNIARRGYERIVGESNIPQVAQRLKQAAPIIPGSQPTAAEAVAGLPAGSPIQALQKVTARTPGGPSEAFGRRLTEQQAARQGALGTIAGGQTPASAIATRATESSKNYAKALQEVVKTDTELKSLLTRPAMQKAEARAIELAKEAGETFAVSKGFYPVKKLHYMKLALDDMIRNPERFALGKTEEAAISKTKDQFVKWIAERSKLYELARSEHARLSVPVNRAQVREALESKLMSPTGQETPGAFVKAVDEAAQMMKRATGNPRYQQIEQVLSQPEAQTARAVAADVERSFLAQRPIQPTDLPGMANIATEAMPKVALLSRPVVIANALLSHLGKRSIEPQVDWLNTQLLLDPRRLGGFLQPPAQLPSRYQIMIDELMRMAPAAAGTAAARNF